MATPVLSTAGTDLLAAGYAGLIADSEEAQVDSFTNTGSTAIDFGVAVVRDTTVDRGCKNIAADTDQVLGVSVRNPLFPASTDGVNTVKYAQYASVPVLRDGVIFVINGDSVTTRRGDQALILTAGGAGNASVGAIGGSAGGVAGSGRVAFPGMNAVWEDAVASAAVGRIRVKTTGTVRTTT